MFTFRDAEGRNIEHIQPEELEDLLINGSFSYWRGIYGFAQIDWQAEGEIRTMMIVPVPEYGFQLTWRTGVHGWIAASTNIEVKGEQIVDVSGEEIAIPRAETIDRQHAAIVARDFLKDGMPSGNVAWLKDGIQVDRADYGLDSLS